MTQEEIIALGGPKADPAPATNGTEPAKGASFPDNWPPEAVKRINQQHGQKIGLQTKLDAERARAVALEQKLREEELRRKRLEAEMPVYQKMAIDQSSARYDLENQRAAESLDHVFRSGKISPEALGTGIGNIVAAKLSQIELKRAADELAAPPPAPAPAPPADFWEQLERDGKTAVKRNIYNADAAQFMAKHGFDLQAEEGTVAAKKKNAALLLDKSAVQRGHLVGSLAYWEFIEDGLRRAVPETGSASGIEHTQTEPAPPSSRAIPSVAAPAARTSTAVNGTSRQRVELNDTDRELLRRNPKLTEELILREKERASR